MLMQRTVVVAATAATAAAAASVVSVVLTLTPESEGDGRENGSEHYETGAARCSDQHHVDGVAFRATSPPPVSRRCVVVRRENVISASLVVVVGQSLIDDQRQVECRRQRWMSAISSNYSQFHHLSTNHTQC